MNKEKALHEIRINLRYGDQKKIADKTGYSRQTVYEALNGFSETEGSETIILAAKELVKKNARNKAQRMNKLFSKK